VGKLRSKPIVAIFYNNITTALPLAGIKLQLTQKTGWTILY
jgi:hypothetical protein